jgi:hypothetical protein
MSTHVDVRRGGPSRSTTHVVTTVVERELASKAELDALVADYLGESAELGDCPMRRTRLDGLLEALS